MVLGGWLVLVWTALWGRLSVANIASGMIVATLLITMFPVAPRGRHTVHPVAVARLAVYFVRKLIESNVAITRTVLSRDDQIRTGIVAVPLTCDSDILLTIVANLTALTPGTMAIEVERQPPRFYVHVLRLDDIEGARAEIRNLERLVIEAFGSDAAIATIRSGAGGSGGPLDRR
ncbi:MAG TPA: Na+/H+ antiporter subunit E [Ilumatobacteraceae bacterium]|nr:Na+/H+ antiporter subunit E [Ilumatobacteraceae bacterium]